MTEPARVATVSVLKYSPSLMSSMATHVVYVAGNPLVPGDSAPLRMMPRLSEAFPAIEFRELEPTDELPEERTLHILDTIIGPDDVTIIDDIDAIVTGKVYSLHDFDLGFTLKLMKKTGKLHTVKIIGVPAHMDDERAYGGVVSALRALFEKKHITMRKATTKANVRTSAKAKTKRAHTRRLFLRKKRTIRR